MRQFLEGSDAAYADLERKATGACLTFGNEEMPVGTSVPRARIGFEVDPASREARLFVDRGLHYRGTIQSVRRWFARGEKRFPDFGALRRWISEDLARAYEPPDRHPSDRVTPVELLTDLDAVQSEIDAMSSLRLDPHTLFQALSGVVRGQDDALRVLARRVCHHLARSAPRRPATILALGPTGVGKTRTAEVLAAALADAGSAHHYLRLDMSEYQERHRVSQLLGAPQGYVGYGDGAQLVDALSANPRTVVLFDEIEKAHPDILRTLMNAMDAGRLSAPSAQAGGSRQVDCRQAIFLFTSNLDPTGILKSMSEHEGAPHPDAVDSICRTQLGLIGVSPELVGRMSCFLVFRPLRVEVQVEIIALAIARVANEYGIEIRHIGSSVILHVLEKARDDRFGARPFEYLVDEVLGDCFAGAGQSHTGTAVTVEGPPFRCTVSRPAGTGSEETDPDGSAV